MKLKLRFLKKVNLLFTYKKKKKEKKNTTVLQILHFSPKNVYFFQMCVFPIFFSFFNVLKLIPAKLKLKFLKRRQFIVQRFKRKKESTRSSKNTNVLQILHFSKKKKKKMYFFRTWNLSCQFFFLFLFLFLNERIILITKRTSPPLECYLSNDQSSLREFNWPRVNELKPLQFFRQLPATRSPRNSSRLFFWKPTHPERQFYYY